MFIFNSHDDSAFRYRDHERFSHGKNETRRYDGLDAKSPVRLKQFVISWNLDIFIPTSDHDSGDSSHNLEHVCAIGYSKHFCLACVELVVL